MKVAAYKPGTPCWVDLGTPDVAATTAFFSALFGWEGVEGPPETGGYVIFTLDGAAVAGAGPLMAPDQPPAWTTYLATDDLAATAAKVESAGGGVILPPMDVMDIGRMGLFADPGGAAIGAWEKTNFAGAGIVNESGALTWNELITRDVDGSKTFYRDAFGLGSKASEVSGDVPYTEFTIGDGIDKGVVGGMMSMVGPQWPEDLPAHWMVYFAVDDCDTAAAHVTKLGGSVSVPPMDIAVGRMAVVADPHGAFFTVVKVTMPD